MERIRVGVDAMSLGACERNVSGWAAGRSQDHDHAIKERQRSVLTNQCLEKKNRMLSRLGEELRNPS